MPEVSLTRLYALRAMYLVLLVMVPLMTAARMVYGVRSFSAADGWGFTACLLTALSLLAAIGLRHPLKMLPLLMFELLWKIIWLARVALPLWRAGRIDDALASNTVATGHGRACAARHPLALRRRGLLARPRRPLAAVSGVSVAP